MVNKTRQKADKQLTERERRGAKRVREVMKHQGKMMKHQADKGTRRKEKSIIKRNGRGGDDDTVSKKRK